MSAIYEHPTSCIRICNEIFILLPNQQCAKILRMERNSQFHGGPRSIDKWQNFVRREESRQFPKIDGSRQQAHVGVFLWRCRLHTQLFIPKKVSFVVVETCSIWKKTVAAGLFFFTKTISGGFSQKQRMTCHLGRELALPNWALWS